MTIKSSDSHYGTVAVTIHWLSALLILVLIGSGFRAGGMEDAAAKAAILQVHVPIGVAILLLTLGRIVWWLFAERKIGDRQIILDIDLNPLQADIVNRPEDYRWSSLGYHVQTDNKDRFLSTDFGLKEFSVRSKKERIKRYRRYVYEAGAIGRPDRIQTKVIHPKVVAKERKKGFEISRISRFRHRTRYFTDSGIIGSKEFVAEHYQRFKHLFYSKHEKKPKPIKGLEGMYSLKRLSEVI